MTPIDPAVLAAVLAEPDSDLPRLIAADWLDDHGEPERAEFIRVQVAGHKAPLSSRQARRWFHPLPWPDGPLTVSVSRAGARLRERQGATGTRPDDPVVFVRRGFVSEVRGPLATLRGGECGVCNGAGDLGTLAGRMGCLRCATGPNKRGTGRTAGVLRGLVRTQPVQVIRVTDKRPFQLSNGRWCWLLDGTSGFYGPHYLPAGLFRRAQGGHAAEADAIDALSAAALAEAKAGHSPTVATPESIAAALTAGGHVIAAAVQNGEVHCQVRVDAGGDDEPGDVRWRAMGELAEHVRDSFPGWEAHGDGGDPDTLEVVVRRMAAEATAGE